LPFFDPRALICSAVRRPPKANRYQRRYLGIHSATLKFDTPVGRSSQIVGISATGSRSRFALAVSSIPISKPSRESMPTSRTKLVEYALNEFVASRVPSRANRRSERPAVRDSMPLTSGPPTCCPPAMYRDAAATATPRSTSLARSSICLESSQPSAIVTTATLATAASMPKRIAFAGPGP